MEIRITDYMNKITTYMGTFINSVVEREWFNYIAFIYILRVWVCTRYACV